MDDNVRRKKCPYIKIHCEDTNADTFRGEMAGAAGYMGIAARW